MCGGGGDDGSDRGEYPPRDTGFGDEISRSPAVDSCTCTQENLARESHDLQRDIDRLQRELHTLSMQRTPRMRDFVRTMLSLSLIHI